MKQLFYFLAGLLLFAACCRRTTEEKIETLIKENVKGTLCFPKSYEVLTTEVDSAYAPFDNPELYDKFKRMFELNNMIIFYDENEDYAGQEVAFWKFYQTSYGNYMYNKALEEKKEAIENKDNFSLELQKLSEIIKNDISETPRFIGYNVVQRFKIKDEKGTVVIKEYKFLVDKDISTVLKTYDLNDPECQAVFSLYSFVCD